MSVFIRVHAEMNGQVKQLYEFVTNIHPSLFSLPFIIYTAKNGKK